MKILSQYPPKDAPLPVIGVVPDNWGEPQVAIFVRGSSDGHSVRQIFVVRDGRVRSGYWLNIAYPDPFDQVRVLDEHGDRLRRDWAVAEKYCKELTQ